PAATHQPSNSIILENPPKQARRYTSTIKLLYPQTGPPLHINHQTLSYWKIHPNRPATTHQPSNSIILENPPKQARRYTSTIKLYHTGKSTQTGPPLHINHQTLSYWKIHPNRPAATHHPSNSIILENPTKQAHRYTSTIKLYHTEKSTQSGPPLHINHKTLSYWKIHPNRPAATHQPSNSIILENPPKQARRCTSTIKLYHTGISTQTGPPLHINHQTLSYRKIHPNRPAATHQPSNSIILENPPKQARRYTSTIKLYHTGKSTQTGPPLHVNHQTLSYWKIHPNRPTATHQPSNSIILENPPKQARRYTSTIKLYHTGKSTQTSPPLHINHQTLSYWKIHPNRPAATHQPSNSIIQENPPKQARRYTSTIKLYHTGKSTQTGPPLHINHQTLSYRKIHPNRPAATHQPSNSIILENPPKQARRYTSTIKLYHTGKSTQTGPPLHINHQTLSYWKIHPNRPAATHQPSNSIIQENPPKQARRYTSTIKLLYPQTGPPLHINHQTLSYWKIHPNRPAATHQQSNSIILENPPKQARRYTSTIKLYHTGKSTQTGPPLHINHQTLSYWKIHPNRPAATHQPSNSIIQENPPKQARRYTSTIKLLYPQTGPPLHINHQTLSYWKIHPNRPAATHQQSNSIILENPPKQARRYTSTIKLYHTGKSTQT
ncbi:uncharacterized protein LOC117320546, partial [Pecten maximus]|uniref:uncharacterized protein LOC117320546 n=1 Tax=Pecten maximus TaxID=6579 RepID=UPI001457EBBC